MASFPLRLIFAFYFLPHFEIPHMLSVVVIFPFPETGLYEKCHRVDPSTPSCLTNKCPEMHRVHVSVLLQGVLLEVPVISVQQNSC